MGGCSRLNIRIHYKSFFPPGFPTKTTPLIDISFQVIGLLIRNLSFQYNRSAILIYPSGFGMNNSSFDFTTRYSMEPCNFFINGNSNGILLNSIVILSVVETVLPRCIFTIFLNLLITPCVFLHFNFCFVYR